MNSDTSTQPIVYTHIYKPKVGLCKLNFIILLKNLLINDVMEIAKKNLARDTTAELEREIDNLWFINEFHRNMSAFRASPSVL